MVSDRNEGRHSKVLQKCLICARNNRKKFKECDYIVASRQGKVGVDVMEISSENIKLIVFVDYFTIIEEN